jgi:hypothetical protein
MQQSQQSAALGGKEAAGRARIGHASSAMLGSGRMPPWLRKPSRAVDFGRWLELLSASGWMGSDAHDGRGGRLVCLPVLDRWPRENTVCSNSDTLSTDVLIGRLLSSYPVNGSR